MGIEDPGWGRIIIVIFFIAILLGFLYFSKNKGKNLFSHISGNQFLKLDGTIALSNISKASVVSAQNQRFLIVHGRGQSPSIILLDSKNYIDVINKKNDVGE
tara:strand:+ start:180 stop:485 length:306 start_codon:yes stop_codon:yes gene_type:complete